MTWGSPQVHSPTLSLCHVNDDNDDDNNTAKSLLRNEDQAFTSICCQSRGLEGEMLDAMPETSWTSCLSCRCLKQWDCGEKTMKNPNLTRRNNREIDLIHLSWWGRVFLLILCGFNSNN